MDFVAEFEHSPDLCPHSNATIRRQFEQAVEEGALEAVAKRLGIEIIFAGIAVPGHKTYLVMRGPDFAAARRLFVESGIVQTNSVQIYITQSLTDFAKDVKNSQPLF